MSSVTSLDKVKKFLQQFMKEENIHEYDIQIEGNTEKGENFMGDITFITLIPRNGKEQYNLVVKTATNSQTLRKAMPIESTYKRETCMYTKVFPELKNFISSVKSNFELSFVPKILWVCEEKLYETLVMENLKYKGYGSWDKSKPMNVDHILLVMKRIGEFHALSLAFSDQKHEKFKEISTNLTNIWIEFSKFIDTDITYGRLLKDVMILFEEAGRIDLVDKFKPIVDNVKYIVTKETPEEDRLVICHGDCWNNNLLFKYEDAENLKPSNLVFVDYQLSMLESPVKDLSYFIYSACDESTLDKVEFFLQTYHESLTSSLKTLGSTRDDIFTYDQLKEHWKKYSSYGLIDSAFIVKIEISSSDEAPDLIRITEQETDLSNIFNFKLKDYEEYKRRMIAVFSHYAEHVL
ncbi:hypothetical protein HHI36_012460 [Cryptolaemus montrouzieri]|uniref:CHK kinase-like domain-containing protein n=1 Tax=Cryptolaemus montrouzieri TaxID=559131 RepID=A0ABD2NEI9_9CUCU